MPRPTADIQADLTAALESRRMALQAQGYSLDTGQGKQSVNRASLSEINKTIRELQAELDEAQNSDAGLMTGSFMRY
jgi:hypothetical protein